jgi:hypothetical protein
MKIKAHLVSGVRKGWKNNLGIEGFRNSEIKRFKNPYP